MTAMTLRNPRLRAAATSLVIAIGLAGCAAMSGRETAGEYVDDLTVTSRVKAEIFNDPTLKSMEISVETMQDVVQLSGFVDSAQARDRAGHLARNVDGVRGLRNNLVVR